ncbi:uncharacterized protein BDZ99DRAFT_560161 [Mytilinidion resinicola]|uniref:Uncharacterized protein n=1 Tax=Mytilinidion resinicola TaxID=574789 RepID=A0A6A6YT69_9PEZI|nr:uncharacterized protein BDZ99DRAFT_560161 [Mytilinidion resinicola]KAF2811758.1 hypothetical protein BDZ99DRAFT_560161 [Mytilinidion resinicola]
MHTPSFTSLAMLAVAISSVFASPIEKAAEFALAMDTRSGTPGSLLKRTDFHWRFYDTGNCDHDVQPPDSFPEGGSPPGDGSIGVCYSAPEGVQWNRVEIDAFFADGGALGLQGFCNSGCGGAASVKQQGTNCYLPTSGCALGSFMVINN